MSLAAAAPRWSIETVPEEQRIICRSSKDWDWGREKKKLLRGSVKDIRIVCDFHLSRAIKTSLKLHTGKLQRLWLYDRRGTLSDRDVRAIVTRNYWLLDINLYAPNLTDKSIIAILKHCPRIAAIRINGLSEASGRVKGHFVSFMNMRENQHKWGMLKKLRLNYQPVVEAQVRSLSKRRPDIVISQSIRVPPPVEESLSNAGIDIPVPARTEWRRGHVEGIDWVALVRREQTRLDDLEQLASQVREERERQRAYEQEQLATQVREERERQRIYEQEQQREISRLLAKRRAQAQQELAIARSHVDSEESDAEDSESEEDCSEEAESGDDNLEDLDARRLGGYGNTSEEEGDSEADELEEEEDTLVEENEEADELEEATEEERSDGEDCSLEETDGEEEEEDEEEDEEDDEIYQNEEDARPSIKAERNAQIADQGIPSTQSRYWVPRGRNTGATIKQESRLSVARALPREPASISADEDDDMRIANGSQFQDEWQLNDRMETDSKDELFDRIKSESRIRAQDAARFENDIERSNVVKSYYPCNPRPPIAFADSVTLRFVSPEDWERRWQRAQRRTGIRMVIFEPSFAVTVTDINMLAWSPAAFSSSILAIRVGNGALLDDQSITNLAANMAQLTQVQIDLAPNIGDQSIMSLIEFCPAIEYIEVCGDVPTRRSGGVTLRNLDAILIANEDKTQRLRHLVLVDQLVEDKSVEACENLRANLKIIRGHQTREEIVPGGRA